MKSRITTYFIRNSVIYVTVISMVVEGRRFIHHIHMLKLYAYSVNSFQYRTIDIAAISQPFKCYDVLF
jgi:hypothetical protein